MDQKSEVVIDDQNITTNNFSMDNHFDAGCGLDNKIVKKSINCSVKLSVCKQGQWLDRGSKFENNRILNQVCNSV